ncbi:MFS transporter [Actinophytocola sp.]|uniref:MFS transporter n=1 Tax=Actinophytocola sp. TaxID=1872138 RepID=UPI002ED058C0
MTADRTRVGVIAGRRVREAGGGATELSAFLLFALLGVGEASLGPLLPVFRQEFDLPASSLALLVSAFFAGALTGTVVVGALPGARLTRAAVLGMLVTAAAGVSGIAVAPGWWGKVVAAAVFGLGLGALTLCVNTYFAGQPGRRGFVRVNLANAAFGVGALAGPAITGLCLPDAYPVEFLVLAVVLVAVVPVTGIAPSLTPRATASPGRTGVAVPFCALLFCYAALESSVATWEPTHLVVEGHSPRAAAVLSALFWAGLATGRLVIPALARRASPDRVVTWCLTGGLGALAVAMIPGLTPAGYALAGLAAGPVLPTCLAWLSATASNPRRACAAGVACAMLGSTAAPLAVGTVITLAGPHLIVPTLAGCTLAALVATSWARRTTRTG